MPFCSASSGAIIAEAEVRELTSPSNIGTGICFLDHMVDQFTSHGQVGVTLNCGIAGGGGEVVGYAGGGHKRSEPEAATRFFALRRDYATGQPDRPHDHDVATACGEALGAALRRVVDDSAAGGDGGVGSGSAIFCCPLDEAFAEARVNLRPAAEMRGKCTIGLEPYGKFSSSPSGRRWIGRYQTALTPVFWKALASSLGAEVTLRRVRGDNAHHVLESAFKAFARAFRAALDNLADGQPHGCAAPSAGPLPPAAAPSVPRRADRRRATKETSIEVRIDLDAPWLHMDAPPTVRASAEPTSRVSTGITTLDKVLLAFSKAAGIEMVVHCEGDRHIDDHHSAEDVAITLGQCVHEALGDKAGLTRMACAEGAEGGARVRAVLDLSNRPHFESDLPLDEEFVGGADVGSKGAGATHDASQDDDASPCGGVLSSEMLFHVFDSLTLEMRSTCHLELLEDSGGTGHTLDLALAAARAFGLALSRAIRVDPRRGGAVASSKGTLSK